MLFHFARFNTRWYFSNRLARGVLEPLIVRLSIQKQGQYEIVAGERRFRAAKLAGLTVVLCLLSNYTNEQAAQIALIENTCREALNPIAEALAIKRLATEFSYTHEEVGLLLVADSKTKCNTPFLT